MDLLPDILIDTTKFKRGDVVRLNSGGPAMTVTTVPDESGGALCQWFGSETRETLAESFPVACLTRVMP